MLFVEKRLVREWAHLRWGLFDENPGDNDAYFYSAGHIPRPTGLVVSVNHLSLHKVVCCMMNSIT